MFWTAYRQNENEMKMKPPRVKIWYKIELPPDYLAFMTNHLLEPVWH